MENTGNTNALKIGVLTFHRCVNYGSYWQSRCLVEGLQAMGHDAELLDHNSRKVNLSEWKCALQPVLPTAVPKADHLLYRKKIEKFFKLFESLPLSPQFPLSEPELMDNYDVVVIGSDEVWNLFHPWYSKCSLFYGENIKAERMISYAASFGNYPFTWGLGEDWSNRLKKFDAISVRDENSQIIIKNALGFEPEMVLDPCLQFSIAPDERESTHWQKPYLAVYGHNFSEFFIDKIKQLASAKKLTLISIGYRNDWADEQWIDADPHDFAHFINRSEAVVTNFFHGCVFALHNSKPFVCETSPYRNNKLKGLMSKIGGEKHLVTEDTTSNIYETYLFNPLDLSIEEKIKMLRSSSNAFLSRALAHKHLQLA
jgi:hypothetical protein